MLRKLWMGGAAALVLVCLYGGALQEPVSDLLPQAQPRVVVGLDFRNQPQAHDPSAVAYGTAPVPNFPVADPWRVLANNFR